MESFYFLGYCLAVVIGIIKLLVSVSMTSSLRSSNFKKIGLHFSPWQGKYVENQTGLISYIFFAIWLILLAPIFSWLSVLSATYMLINYYVNKTEPSEALKNIQFKVANTHLSKDQMVELFKESASQVGAKEEDIAPIIEQLDESKESEENLNETFGGKPCFRIESTGWSLRYVLNTANKTIDIKSLSTDDGYKTESLIQYRLDGNNIFTRTINEKDTGWFGITEPIKDNVVIESVIAEICKENRLYKYDEEMKKHTDKVSWSPVTFHKLKFFILKNHPEIIPKIELRKLARQEVERLKKGRAEFEAEATKYNCYLKDNEECTEFEMADPKDETYSGEISLLFSDEGFRKYNVTRNEVVDYHSIVKYLNLLLEKT